MCAEIIIYPIILACNKDDFYRAKCYKGGTVTTGEKLRSAERENNDKRCKNAICMRNELKRQHSGSVDDLYRHTTGSAKRVIIPYGLLTKLPNLKPNLC